jgi:hypothetical protein
MFSLRARAFAKQALQRHAKLLSATRVGHYSAATLALPKTEHRSRAQERTFSLPMRLLSSVTEVPTKDDASSDDEWTDTDLELSGSDSQYDTDEMWSTDYSGSDSDGERYTTSDSDASHGESDGSDGEQGSDSSIKSRKSGGKRVAGSEGESGSGSDGEHYNSDGEYLGSDAEQEGSDEEGASGSDRWSSESDSDNDKEPVIKGGFGTYENVLRGVDENTAFKTVFPYRQLWEHYDEEGGLNLDRLFAKFDQPVVANTYSHGMGGSYVLLTDEDLALLPEGLAGEMKEEFEVKLANDQRRWMVRDSTKLLCQILDDHKAARATNVDEIPRFEYDRVEFPGLTDRPEWIDSIMRVDMWGDKIIHIPKQSLRAAGKRSMDSTAEIDMANMVMEGLLTLPQEEKPKQIILTG